jgi:hypothetical protein
MFDYNTQIIKYHEIKVNLPNEIKEKLRRHRKANQDRLINNIREGITINQGSFIKQGSYAMKTIIQEKNNAYDIDDGVVFIREELTDPNGSEMNARQIKEIVRDALFDEKFNKKPEIKLNCVRLFYAEGHHVDIPAYRKFSTQNGEEIQEIASDSWRESYPQQINIWFDELIKKIEKANTSSGDQFRMIIRLLKRFSKSRDNWNMPSGLKLTMLAAECYKYYKRCDEAFYYLVDSIGQRFSYSIEILNLADENYPKEKLTLTSEDKDVLFLKDKIREAIENLKVLFMPNCSMEQARNAWDWVFHSDGFFDAFDKDEKKAIELYEKMVLVEAGLAHTNSFGKISTTGIPNKPHKFYGK